MKKNLFNKVFALLFICLMAVCSFTGCSETGETGLNDAGIIEPDDGAGSGIDIEPEATEFAPKWTVGTIDDDLEYGGKIWENSSFMNGSNAECVNGELSIFVDEGSSSSFDGSVMQSQGGGVTYPLDDYSTLSGSTFEVELELPAAYPEFSEGIAVAQTFGIFEKTPDDTRSTKGVFVNFGFCPGSAQFDSDTYSSLSTHHYSFDGTDPSKLRTGDSLDMGFIPLDKDLVRQTVSIKLEINETSIKFYTNGAAEAYHTIDVNTVGESGSDYELRIMTHAAVVEFGTYDPLGAPYMTSINSVTINGENIPLCL